MGDKAYDVILWDWNGTLLDDAQFGADIVNGLLRKRGLPERSLAEHGALFDFPVIRYYERLGFDFAREPFEQISHDFVASYYATVEHCPLQAGARGVLEALRSAGYRQVMLSATRQDLLERIVGAHGLLEFFEDLLGIDSVHAPGKTARGCAWIRESGLDPARVLLVGDTVHDAEVAEKMGVDCWLVKGGHHPLARLLETGRPLFDDLSAVLAVLDGAPARKAGAC